MPQTNQELEDMRREALSDFARQRHEYDEGICPFHPGCSLCESKK